MIKNKFLKKSTSLTKNDKNIYFKPTTGRWVSQKKSLSKEIKEKCLDIKTNNEGYLYKPEDDFNILTLDYVNEVFENNEDLKQYFFEEPSKSPIKSPRKSPTPTFMEFILYDSVNNKIFNPGTNRMVRYDGEKTRCIDDCKKLYEMYCHKFKNIKEAVLYESYLYNKKREEESGQFDVPSSMKQAEFEEYCQKTPRKKIRIYKNSNIKRIPALDHLVELRIESCSNLKEIGLCPNLKSLYLVVCPKMTFIPSFPKLYVANIHQCDIVKIPFLPLLECINSDIINIPVESVPLLEELHYQNVLITNIPEYPNLVRLNVGHCKNLTTISDLPNLIELNCRGSSKLKKLPNCPKTENLTIWCCSLISDIPNKALLKKLDCSNCKSITSLTNFPSLIELDCRNCINLVKIENIPQLESLNCQNCPKLTKIPQWTPKLTELRCDKTFRYNLEARQNLHQIHLGKLLPRDTPADTRIMEYIGLS